MKDIRLVILSGPSGSGKSIAVKALEDIGFFCVDNMPVSLIPKFMELLDQSREISKVAAVVDVREREFLGAFSQVFDGLKDIGYRVEMLFLEANDETLLRRFNETRRRHPLASDDTPIEGIIKERELLGEVKRHADKVVDTTSYNVHQLREFIKEHFSGPVTSEKMTVSLISFGYRYGIPPDADIVIDIRFLPNPYFVESLKTFDGTDSLVKNFVLEKQETKEFLKRFKDFLDYLIPLYWKEGKAYLTIAVGCTGGKHRSVVVTDVIEASLDSSVVAVRKRHRDINKP